MWQRELSLAVGDRGEELNNALGHLPEFADSGADLLSVLDEHERSLRGLVRDTGEVYEALTEDESQLANLIRGSHGVFRQTAAERESLAEAFGIFPTFLTESKTTLRRLEGFSREARPLVRDLRPVARELRPTVPRVRSLAPHLRRFFMRFDDQIGASRTALPALRQTLDETRPLFQSLGPFLGELNPIFQWLELHQQLVGDFLGYSASALADTVPGVPAGEVGHYLRQLGVTGTESLGIHRNRVSSNRGNAYLPPVIPSRETAARMNLPSWDCNPSGGEVDPKPAQFGAVVGCWTVPGPFPHVLPEDYGR
jgi:ABC-type transporter Mla subunit MlaD